MHDSQYGPVTESKEIHDDVVVGDPALLKKDAEEEAKDGRQDPPDGGGSRKGKCVHL